MVNPLYSSHVKTNVGKIFMKLIVKHFPKHHRYHKIFNKNTIKLSYSCMQNMGNIITKHNNKLLFQSFEQPTRMCNCRDEASCPMDGNCLQKCFVYQAQVGSANSRNYYLRTSGDEFKTRYNDHSSSGKWSGPGHFLKAESKFFLSFLCALFYIFLTPKNYKSSLSKVSWAAPFPTTIIFAIFK